MAETNLGVLLRSMQPVDHIFVPVSRAEDAMRVLLALALES
jgi:hypothetical protein